MVTPVQTREPMHVVIELGREMSQQRVHGIQCINEGNERFQEEMEQNTPKEIWHRGT
ncbi:hypothetical protein Scep_026219 [Stephania cephalantha]|uniref:Uncharacterized protein n=1 Tax=Stephania cephalantha TaxID=152367 RepID=A0AAP0EJQ2_9MAGN